MGATLDRMIREGLTKWYLNRQLNEVREQAYKYWQNNNPDRMQQTYKGPEIRTWVGGCSAKYSEWEEKS